MQKQKVSTEIGWIIKLVLLRYYHLDTKVNLDITYYAGVKYDLAMKYSICQNKISYVYFLNEQAFPFIPESYQLFTFFLLFIEIPMLQNALSDNTYN